MADISSNSHRKIGAMLLVLFGVLAITLAVLQLRNTIYSPFALKNTLPSNLKQQIVDDNVAYQQQHDTDRDGLSDFDEKNVYGTSAFLYDTFGYGFSDAEVVRRGLPLCPGAGKNCAGVTASTPGASASSSLISSFEPTGNNPAAPIPDFQTIFNDPKQLRQILRDSKKIPIPELDKISDADLVKAAQAFLNSTSTLNGASTTTTTTTTTSTR